MTFEERRKIDKLLSEGYGCTAISNTLGISINSVNDYSAPWNAPIRNKENGNPNQGTHQSAQGTHMPMSQSQSVLPDRK